MTSIVMTSYRIDRTEPTDKLLQEKLIRYHTDLKLIYMLPIMQYTTRRQFRVHGHFQIRLEQPTPSLQNCHAHSLKTAKTL